jgi:hypothetical protein
MTSIQRRKSLYRLITQLLPILLLAGCASGGAGESDGGTVKVGMHIDALLEFAIEYPLDWKKQRLLYRAEDRGEVRWTPPGGGKVQLAVSSQPLNKAISNRQARLDVILEKLPGFEITFLEEHTLPGGKAQHVMGHTAQLNYDLLLLESSRRVYTILFSAPLEDFDRFEDIIDEITQSFFPLEPDDESTHTDR